MTTQTITLPCKITFEWFPEEKETFFEPRVYEEFQVTSMLIENISELTDEIGLYGMRRIEDNLYKYLKENKDEP